MNIAVQEFFIYPFLTETSVIYIMQYVLFYVLVVPKTDDSKQKIASRPTEIEKRKLFYTQPNGLRNTVDRII